MKELKGEVVIGDVKAENSAGGAEIFGKTFFCPCIFFGNPKSLIGSQFPPFPLKEVKVGVAIEGFW